MLLALKGLFQRGHIPSAQLALDLEPQPAPPPAPRDADELLARLRTLGLARIERCRLTRNRNVMVSYRGAELRVHCGYLDAPPEIHEAIVGFVCGKTRAERRLAQRMIVSFKVETARGESRRERTRPEDAPLAAKLTEWHARYNADHFDGALKVVPVRVSRRMKSRLGHYSAASHGESGEIAISWRHFRRHGWTEALHTLLHEMVHQWQDENGHALDHGRTFRAKAREVGIAPAAKRAPGSSPD
jgi:SprT-like family protein